MKRLLALSLVVACGHEEAGGKGADQPELAPGAAKLSVTSTAFAEGAEIPIDHTCEGADIAPALAWSGAPAQTRAFAIVVDDPDAPDPAAPKQTWVHWVVVGLPASATSLPAGGALPAGAAAGTNDFGKAAWGGPCPPIGRHRYVFKVYALDAALGQPGMTKKQLLAAIAGHVIGAGQLIGTYQKKK
ncbi:MAG TPA: YbhB/YbcL family Raf kinase inhibitor-like protein [Kofleriaceae bacterium]|nr:YbhB/YbcL family Raf kinase inhibitor-like protein [Kofleriaceae bacterium]